MTSRFSELVVDCHDPHALARFWCAILDYAILDDREDQVEIGPKDLAGEQDDEFVEKWKARLRAAPSVPTIVFGVVPEGKTVKDRIHIDVSPVDATHEDEVERVISLGARRVDIGQGDVRWTVLADPEGNEFCILRSLQ